jgi:hypothetical protein
VPVENLMRDGFSVDEAKKSCGNRHPRSNIADQHSLKLCLGCFEVFDPIIEGADPRRICSAINNVPVSGGVSFVEMVQATDLRNRKDFADGLNGSGIRRVFPQRKM